MEGLIILLLLHVLVYDGYIIALSVGFRKCKPFESAASVPEITFSIIIPFRNEEQHLRPLLASLSALDYPRDKFELLFIDDFSDDFSVNVINKWRMQHGEIQTTLLENLRLSASPKKDAISRAVPVIQNQWIITTDADCIVPATWLKTLNDYILANDVKMIAAPVAYDGKKTFLHHFQRLDMLALQGVTIGSFGTKNPFMCNGANFAYSRKLFVELGGFGKKDSSASGDDVFLLQRAVAADASKVHFLKSDKAVVRTLPVPTWHQLLQQRTRWGAKTTHYKSAFGTELALFTFLANFAVALVMVLAIVKVVSWPIAAGFLILKCVPDFILLAQSNLFFNKRKFFFPLFSAIVYPFFCVSVVACAIFGKYEWKGRTYKK